MGAIYMNPVIKRATVNSTECVECYACFLVAEDWNLNLTRDGTDSLRKLFLPVDAAAFRS